MALNKTTDYKGIDAEYWRIINTRTNYRGEEADTTTIAILGLYLNRDSRDVNIHNEISTRELIVSGGDLNRADIYALAKASGCYWNDATDC